MRLFATKLRITNYGGLVLPSIGNVFVYTQSGQQLYTPNSQVVEVSASFATDDELSLDLAFALDRTVKARRGPNPVFTRSSTATFVSSTGTIQTAAANVPRFDHDPLTGICRGLLLEETRTNAITRSATFSDAAWTKLGATVSLIGSAPGLGDFSTALIENSANAEHGIFISDGLAGALTMSIFVKQRGRRFCYLRRDTLGANAVFDLSLGTVTQINGGGTASITAFPNSWWRIAWTTTATGNWVLKLSDTGAVASNSSSYQGDGVSGIEIWGAQAELGSFATSYIPTSGTTVQRSSDSCRIFGNDFTNLFNQSEGTILVQSSEFRRGSSFPVIAGINNSADANNNRIAIGGFGNKTSDSSPLEFLAVTNGVVQYSTTPNSSSANFTAALAYGSDNVRGALDGVLLPADTPPSVITSAADQLIIGGVGSYVNRVQYFRKRIADSGLASLPQLTLDPDTLRFVNVTNATDFIAINDWVRGIKNLGLWDSIVCWPMRSTQNYGSGTQLRALGGLGGFDGTLSSEQQWGVNGINFNGVNDFISIPNPGNINISRFSIWSVFDSDLTVNRAIFGASGISGIRGPAMFAGGSMFQGSNASSLYGEITSNGTSQVGSGMALSNGNTGSWQTAFFGANNTEYGVSVNGGTRSVNTISMLSAFNQTTTWRMGANLNNSYFFAGQQAMNLFANVYLTPAQVLSIRSLYASTLGAGLGLP